MPKDDGQEAVNRVTGKQEENRSTAGEQESRRAREQESKRARKQESKSTKEQKNMKNGRAAGHGRNHTDSAIKLPTK